jgi:hypothetical protein
MKNGDRVKVPDGRIGTLMISREDKAAVQFLAADRFIIEPFKLSDLVKAPEEPCKSSVS